MMPAPKDELLEGHHSLPTASQPRVRIPLVSPTGLSNAMPRPKSPRHPDRKGFSAGPGLLAAEHFHNTASDKQHQVPPPVTDERQEARGRRTRSRDRIGHFGRAVTLPTLSFRNACRRVLLSRRDSPESLPRKWDQWHRMVSEDVFGGLFGNQYMWVVA
jgi:hypothetical protein